jgi:hypothetical protein
MSTARVCYLSRVWAPSFSAPFSLANSGSVRLILCGGDLADDYALLLVIVDNGHLVAWSANYNIERIGAGGLLSGVHTGEGFVCRFV